MVRPIKRVPNRNKSQFARRTSQVIDIPAPAGGKNSRDSLGLMPITDAVELINWLPTSNGLRSRKGSATQTSYSTQVETVISYVSGSTSTLITAEGGNLYTDDGAGTKNSIASSLTNDRWFAAKIAENMVLVNGADAPRNFDGSSITTPTFSGDLSTYGEENIDGINLHKNRLYMWDSDYGNFFYGGTNSVSGAFAEFNLNRVSSTGGNLLEMKTISRDAGDGPDDYAAFILDTGEILIYQGSDPGDANSWALVGKYMAPPLISKGCAHEFAGDVLMLTRADLIKLSDVIKYGSESGGFNIAPSKLTGDIKSDFAQYGTNYGWQLLTFPSNGWIVINVPEVVNSDYHQYIVDTVTGGYTKIMGWDAIRFGSHDGKLYFGGATDLWQASTGLTDNGADISLIAQPAFNNLGVSRKKKISNARLYVESEGEINADLQIAYDYNAPAFQGTQSSQTVGAEWDVAEWDTAEWAGVSARLVNFVTSGVGLYVTIQLQVKISGQELIWYETTYNFDVAAAY